MGDQENGQGGPLAGLTVVDFSTLLPGPLASLVLAEAGADVIKIERPGVGDDMRSYDPKIGGQSANFALLNRGKRSIALDLKNATDNATARRLAADADILVEQFRPGVMAKLGLSYESLSAENPGLIYCSITGYGQHGARAKIAAHDLNYVADAGMLSLVTDADGTPSLPPIPVADIGGGTMPSIINILLALYERTRTGKGRHLDVAMTDHVLPFVYWAIGSTLAGAAPKPSNELITGGSPRYAIYRTKDGRHIAAAPLEDKFWSNFCRILEVSEDVDHSTVAAVMATRDTEEWERLFAGHDICCSVVRSMHEVMADPAFIERGLFRRTVETGGQAIPALPVPLVEVYRDQTQNRPMPRLGGVESCKA